MLDLSADHGVHRILVSKPVLSAPVNHTTVGTFDHIPADTQHKTDPVTEMFCHNTFQNTSDASLGLHNNISHKMRQVILDSRSRRGSLWLKLDTRGNSKPAPCPSCPPAPPPYNMPPGSPPACSPRPGVSGQTQPGRVRRSRCLGNHKHLLPSFIAGLDRQETGGQGSLVSGVTGVRGHPTVSEQVVTGVRVR